MVSTTFPPPLFGCLFGAKKWHTSFQHAVKNDQHMMSHRDNRNNRYEAEEEEALQRRSSDPLWPRVLRWASRGARRSVNREKAGWEIELRKYTTRTPTQLTCAEGNTDNGDSASPCSVRRSRRPQARLETSCTRTGRPRRCLRPNSAAGRREKAQATRPACTSARSHTAA